MTSLKLTESENDQDADGEEFIFTVQDLHAMDGLTVGECIAISGEPPSDFNRFVVEIAVTVGHQKLPNGQVQPIVFKHRFNVPAADVHGAFALARNMIPAEVEKVQTESRNQIFRKNIITPNGMKL